MHEFRIIAIFCIATIGLPVNGNVIAEPDIGCGSEDNCPTPDDFICAFELEHACFRPLPTECHMDIYACKQEKVLRKFTKAFCNIEGFMCYDYYKEKMAEYFANEDIDKVVYSIYRQEEETALALVANKNSNANVDDLTKVTVDINVDKVEGAIEATVKANANDHADKLEKKPE